MGTPPGGFPEPFRTAALEGRRRASIAVDLSEEDHELLDGDDVRATLSRLLLPGPAASHAEHVDRYGDLSVLPSKAFWYGLEVGGEDTVVELEPGVRIVVGLEALGEPNDDGMRPVVFRLNGQLRPIEVRDRSVAATSVDAERADPSSPGHVAAPFRGVVSVSASVGDPVAVGDQVAVIEAMKMESQISATVDGVVERVVVGSAAAVEPGDLLLVVRPTGSSGAPEARGADS